MSYPVALNHLVQELAKLPGIGHKTAKRLAFSLLFSLPDRGQSLAQSILDANKKIGECSICFGLAESDTCIFCNNPAREHGILCIVESPSNIFTIEASGIFHGVYHVLHGAIAPMKGIAPENLKIPELEKRIQAGGIQELILATNPTLEGEATAHYLMEIYKEKIPVISRIAQGMPNGADLEYADSTTLTRAFEGRVHFQ